MAELVSQERLQPSLLDRLIDHAPSQQREGDDKKALTKNELRQAVLRDLTWLFNATGFSPSLDEKRYSHAAKSVLNFGLPTMSGQFASSVQRSSMEKMIRQAIVDFEPRILAHTLEVEIVLDGPVLDAHNRVGLVIRGMLWAQPVPLEFLMRSQIDLEEGRFMLEDVSA